MHREVTLRMWWLNYRRNRFTPLHEVHGVIESLLRIPAKKMNTDIIEQIELRSLHQIIRRFPRPCSPIPLQSTKTKLVKLPIRWRTNPIEIVRHDDFAQSLAEMKPPTGLERHVCTICNWQSQI